MLPFYEALIEEAYQLLIDLPGDDPRRSDIRKAANALKSYITSGNTVYIPNADLLGEALAAAMNAELPDEGDTSEDVSAEESLPETSAPAPAPAPAPAEKSFPWGWVAGGILALGAIAAAAVFFAKKKK